MVSVLHIWTYKPGIDFKPMCYPKAGKILVAQLILRNSFRLIFVEMRLCLIFGLQVADAKHPTDISKRLNLNNRAWPIKNYFYWFRDGEIKVSCDVNKSAWGITQHIWVALGIRNPWVVNMEYKLHNRYYWFSPFMLQNSWKIKRLRDNTHANTLTIPPSLI